VGVCAGHNIPTAGDLIDLSVAAMVNCVGKRTPGRSKVRIWISLLVVPLLLTACGPASQPGDRQAAAPGAQITGPKRITAAIMSNPPTISADNVVAGSGTYQGGDALEELMNAGLTYMDELGRRRPQLAEAAPTLENGLWKVLPDGRMETSWTLRSDAVWHDGTPITTADLLFTADLSRDKDLPVFEDPEWDYVESLQARDARTLVAHWKSTYIRADNLLLNVRPKHILERTFVEDKLAVLSHPYWNEQFIGAGPFRLKEFARDSHLIMSAYDGYIFGRPKIDEITVRFIPDNNALIASILAGEVQLTLGRNLSLQQSMELKEHWKDGYIDVGFSNWIALWPQMLNPNPPVLLDVRFRRALLHAMDRKQMNETLLYNAAPLADVLFHPGEPAFRDIEPFIVKYEYDPRRAIQLIESLGYARGADGFFRDASGQTLPLEVRTSGGEDTHEMGLFSAADYFRQVGIAAEPFIIPQAQRNDREFNATFPGVRLWRQNNDILSVDRLHSREATLAANRFTGSNRSRYMNAEFDAMIDKYMVTISERERVPMLQQIVRHITENVTLLDLWYNAETIMVGNRLQNVVNKKTSRANQAWNAHEWVLQ